jgi:hypothetical protein
MSRNAAHIDIDAFQADQEAALDQERRDLTGAQPRSPPGEQPSRRSTP